METLDSERAGPGIIAYRPESTSEGSEEPGSVGPTRPLAALSPAWTSAEPEGKRCQTLRLRVPDGKGSLVHGRGLARSRTPRRLRGSGYSETCQFDLVESRSRGGWARSRRSRGYGAGILRRVQPESRSLGSQGGWAGAALRRRRSSRYPAAYHSELRSLSSRN